MGSALNIIYVQYTAPYGCQKETFQMIFCHFCSNYKSRVRVRTAITSRLYTGIFDKNDIFRSGPRIAMLPQS